MGSLLRRQDDVAERYIGQEDGEIARYGDKLDRNVAELLFPTFAAVLEYRE